MSAHGELMFVGCYTADHGGTGAGVAVLRRDARSGELTVLGSGGRMASPSFLARHPRLPVLYAVSEVAQGAVSAWAVAADGGLSRLAVRGTAGSEPCHLAVTADGRHLVVANYGGGSVAVFPIDARGVPAERSDLLRLTGRGPHPQRQRQSHAHQVWPAGPGADLLVTDLGADRVHRVEVDPLTSRLRRRSPAVVAEPGSGPRHLARTGDGGLLVVGELAGTLTRYRAGPDGQLRAVGRIMTAAGPGPTQPSEVVIGHDGRFGYVANRGPDTVTVLSLAGPGLTRVAEVATGGRWPRHLALVADHLYVANERSHTVMTFRIDVRTGVPVEPGRAITVPSPTCVLRWRPTIGNARRSAPVSDN